MLVYEGIKIGSKIRAYDFRPMNDIDDRFVEGIIVDEVRDMEYFYRVEVTYDSTGMNREIVHVPMELVWDEFEGRVTVINDNLSVGTHIIVYDNLSDNNSYIEGVITDITDYNGLSYYIEVERDTAKNWTKRKAILLSVEYAKNNPSIYRMLNNGQIE